MGRAGLWMCREEKKRKWNEKACFTPWRQQGKCLCSTNGKYFYFQDTNSVEKQNVIGAKESNVTKNFPDLSYSNADREYVRNTLFSRNNEL